MARLFSVRLTHTKFCEMNKKRILTVIALASFVLIYSCKKENTSTPDPEVDATKIIEISAQSSNRIDASDAGLEIAFQDGNSTTTKSAGFQATLPASYPYTLVYRGKINPMLGKDGQPLSALQVAAYSNYYAVGYQTPGDKFGGGIDVFQMQGGAPVLLSSVSTPDADVTCVANGGGKMYFGMDLGTFESYGFEKPATVGVVKTTGGSLSEPGVVGLKGYSVKDLKYNTTSGKLYAATSTEGGLSVINVSAAKPKLNSFTYFGGSRSLDFAENEVVATNTAEYQFYDLQTGVKKSNAFWPIPSNDRMGSLTVTPDGNLMYGNNYKLVYVDKATNALLDEIDLGGWINSITVVDGKIYVAAGNSLVVATVSDGKIKALAKTHFATAFGGSFNVISVKVAGIYVFVACGNRGTYVFSLKKAA